MRAAAALSRHQEIPGGWRRPTCNEGRLWAAPPPSCGGKRPRRPKGVSARETASILGRAGEAVGAKCIRDRWGGEHGRGAGGGWSQAEPPKAPAGPRLCMPRASVSSSIQQVTPQLRKRRQRQVWTWSHVGYPVEGNLTRAPRSWELSAGASPRVLRTSKRHRRSDGERVSGHQPGRPRRLSPTEPSSRRDRACPTGRPRVSSCAGGQWRKHVCLEGPRCFPGSQKRVTNAGVPRRHVRSHSPESPGRALPASSGPRGPACAPSPGPWAPPSCGLCSVPASPLLSIRTRWIQSAPASPQLPLQFITLAETLVPNKVLS